MDRGSLTKRLKAQCKYSFEVNVLFEGVGRIQQHEKRVLKCALDFGWIREVELKVDGTTWVIARSVVPLSTLKGADLQLRYLGNKPLGQLLFSHPRYQRKEFEIGVHKDIWGRRSIFNCSKQSSEITQGITVKSLLVSEVFMPVVFSEYSS